VPQVCNASISGVLHLQHSAAGRQHPRALRDEQPTADTGGSKTSYLSFLIFLKTILLIFFYFLQLPQGNGNSD
jgi:hypothetical protein